LTGVVTIGSGNFGFVNIYPTLARDTVAVVATNSTFTGTNNAVSSLNTGLTAYSNPQATYTLSQFTDGSPQLPPTVRGRIVSVGLRWRYIGTNLNMGGRVLALVHPDHNNLESNTYVTLASFKEAVHLPCSRKWQEMVIFSNQPSEIEYPNLLSYDGGYLEAILSAYPLSSTQFGGYYATQTVSQTCGGCPMTVFFESSSAGNQWEFQVVSHMEFVGSLAQHALTKSHADATGFSVIQEAANSSYLNRVKTMANEVASSFNQGLQAGINSLSGTAGAVVGSSLGKKIIEVAANGDMIELY